MKHRFLQVHSLTSYPHSLVNRDDAGFAKRSTFGGVPRTRISRQCQKFHIRTNEGPNSLASLGLDMAVRSRVTFDRYLFQPLIDKHDVDPKVAQWITTGISEIVTKGLPKSGKEAKAFAVAGQDDDEEVGGLHTEQVLVLGQGEMRYFLELALKAVQASRASKDEEFTPRAALLEIVKEPGMKANLEALRRASHFGLDAALHGRMVTGDLLANVDAAVHVDDAFTVHSEFVDDDFISAGDSLKQIDGESGSAHMNSIERPSGLYYGYAKVDLPLLVSNIEGCPVSESDRAPMELTAHVIENFVHSVATASAAGPKTATRPSLMMVEVGNAQPLSHAGAFEKPVPPMPHLTENAFRALGEHVATMDEVWDAVAERRVLATGPKDILVERLGEKSFVKSLNELAQWAASTVRGTDA